MQWSVLYGPEDIFYNQEKKHMWVNTSWESFIASDQINIYRIGSILDLHAWSQTPTLIHQNSITPSMSLFWIVCFWTAFHLNGVEDFDILSSKPKSKSIYSFIRTPFNRNMPFPFSDNLDKHPNYNQVVHLFPPECRQTPGGIVSQKCHPWSRQRSVLTVQLGPPHSTLNNAHAAWAGWLPQQADLHQGLLDC